MKAIILACTPNECEKIANGDMSILVRKVVPKETPFKVYVYGMHKAKIVKHYRYEGKSRIIGEFICNKVGKYDYDDDCGVDIDRIQYLHHNHRHNRTFPPYCK